MTSACLDSFKSRKDLNVKGRNYVFYSLAAAAESGLGDISRLPRTLKVLLENLLRNEDGQTVNKSHVLAVAEWLKNRKSTTEIAYHPARVLMQDFTGVPAVVDLAAMRDAMKQLKGDPEKINPLSPVDLVIDHSVMVDNFGDKNSFQRNVDLEFNRNQERYTFLRWGQKAFNNFQVVPPGTGICHQVNLEYLGQIVWTKEEGNDVLAYPDTLVGTDSHTTMINGLSVLGWGVGGIEAEAAMLGQPISMLIPEVIGFKLDGELREGATATDLVLTVVQMLREKGVVGKFVEFYGSGLDHLSLADKATIANMAPEYGATCGFFPVDGETINYLSFTGREQARVQLVEDYAKAQGLWRDKNSPDPEFTDTLSLDISTVEASIAGPKRPQDRIELGSATNAFKNVLPELTKQNDISADDLLADKVEVKGMDCELGHGDVVIAAITSCTNTSNPSVMVAAGLLAKNARAEGLKVKPWVKTSLAPGSQVVSDYLEQSGLQKDLDALGFNLVGYGCTTCIGNSGPLPENVTAAIEKGSLVVTSVLSGNRNFEGRISPFVKANYLASPPLVVAYALAGTMNLNLKTDPLGEDKEGNKIYLTDIWPSSTSVRECLSSSLTSEMFVSRYSNVFQGPPEWQNVKAEASLTYDWDNDSTYVKQPPYFDNMERSPGKLTDIDSAYALAVLGDSVTTDHISPAGTIKKDSPAGEYLINKGVEIKDFNSYGSRRGNHEVMMRGTFANIRLRNEMAPGTEGGYTNYVPEDNITTIYAAAMKYHQAQVPLVVVAGKEYGTGSSRDWAAKGTRLLGVRAVIAESFERIHRSNLIGMGVLPLQFQQGESRKSLNIVGEEKFSITGIASGIQPRGNLTCKIERTDGSVQEISLLCRIDTLDELEYYRHGGILHYVLRKLV